MNDIIVTELTLSSLEVAEMLPKRHTDLLRDVEKYSNYLESSIERNFALNDFWQESIYKDKIGRTLKCYQITKKGCEFLAHKMTGKKGAVFTAIYINRFHEMEKSIQQGYIGASDLGCKTYMGQPVMTINDFAALANRNRSTILWQLKRKGLSHIKLMREDIDTYKRENNIPCKQAISALVIFIEATAYKLASILFNRTDEINVAIANYFGKQPVAVKKEKPKLLPLSEYSDIKAQAEVINERIITIKHLLDRAFTRKNTPNTLYAYNSILLDLGVNIGNDMVGLSEHIDDVLNAFIDE